MQKSIQINRPLAIIGPIIFLLIIGGQFSSAQVTELSTDENNPKPMLASVDVLSSSDTVKDNDELKLLTTIIPNLQLNNANSTSTTLKPKFRSAFLSNNDSKVNNNNRTASNVDRTKSKWADQSLETALTNSSGKNETETGNTKPNQNRKGKFRNNKKLQSMATEKPVSASAADVAKTPYKPPPILKQIHDYLIVVLLVSVMFAMGCSITWSQVWGHVCKPIGVIIGMISQFVLLPAAAYALIVVFNIDPLYATGLLILACSPGGVTSNVFAYFCEGDLSLSVTMTSVSTVVALFMMPFNVWLYGRNLETDTLVIPYAKMSISLLSLTAPVGVGMLVKWKLPKLAAILTRIGSFAGFSIILICQILELFIFPDIFKDVPPVLYAAEFLLPLLGMALGFGAASVLSLPYPVRRTIAIEAGIQNIGTALTIITLSFPFEQLRKVWLFPFLYAFSMLAVCCAVALLYRVQKRITHKVKSLDIMDHPKLQQIKLQQQMQYQNQQQQQQQQQPSINDTMMHSNYPGFKAQNSTKI